MNRGTLKIDELMSRHTSWRVGGYADKYYIPADLDDLISFLGEQPDSESCTWIGLGSNLLVRDGGIRGTVIAITGALDEITIINKNIIRVSAGVTCAKAARYIAKNGYRGSEFLAGIPGTIGGALAMNAGAFGCDIWSIISHAETLDRDGNINSYRAEDLNVGYRSVEIPEEEWFIAAEFDLEHEEGFKSLDEIKILLKKRNKTQPTNQLSCGSVFQNPVGDHAGRLIEAAGLKGYCLGGASVSEIHANFIINNGSATAHEIENLIEYVKLTVSKKFNVDLQPEVRIIGEFSNE